MNSYLIDKKRPQILSLATSRVGEWSMSSWKWLARFRVALLQRVRDESRQSSRTMRREQREAISEVLKVVFQYLDLNTMCVGFYHRETSVFVHLSMDFLAKKAGLPIRRAQRAMNWLYQSGYIVGYRQSSYDIDTNEYYHKPSIRRVNIKLLLDLGITEFALQKARGRSKKRFEGILLNALSVKDGSDHISVKNELKVQNILNGFAKAFSLTSNTKPVHPPSVYYEKLEQLMKLMPNLTTNEAKKMLPAPESYL